MHLSESGDGYLGPARLHRNVNLVRRHGSAAADLSPIEFERRYALNGS